MISVVIPLYNKAHTIERTLGSVLNQTFTNFEVVIVNDGSIDNGVEVIKNFTSDPRIRIINQENQGVSVARNRGVAESKMKFIAFLDGDDEWFPDHLEKVIETFKRFPDVGFVLSGRYSQNIKTNIKICKIPKKYLYKYSKIKYFENPHVYSHISSTVVDGDLVRSNNETWANFIPNQKTSEDFTFMFKLALHCQVGYCGFPTSIYNGMVEGQVTAQIKDNLRMNDTILFHNSVLTEWKKTKFNDKLFPIFLRYEIRHIVLDLLRKNRNEDIKLFLNGLNEISKKIIRKHEFFIYCKFRLKHLSKAYILISKLIWRLHNYPKVTS